MENLKTPKTIWKIASRWSDYGISDSSILDIFIKHNVVFVYDGHAEMEAIEPDDIIAISDGYSIVALAKRMSDELTEFSELKLSEIDKARIPDGHEKISCMKVSIKTLSKDDILRYETRRGRIHKIWNIHTVSEIKDRVNKYFFGKEKFDLAASDYNAVRLFKEIKLFIVPIYQRPYSWGEAEVERLMNDAMNSFMSKEPMFIGTMQHSWDISISPARGIVCREIVDGQQRLITMVLIFKALSLFCNTETMFDFDNFSLFETRVNGGEQQKKFSQALKIKNISELSAFPNNQFAKNLERIHEIFNESINKVAGDIGQSFDINKFQKYLKNDVKFVIIKTRANLSTTIKIFNTINTSGLDLNTGDLFKIRCFDYLTVLGGRTKDCFSEISALYEEIERENGNKYITSMEEILTLYQMFIIAKFDLPVDLIRDYVGTFYERLFDTAMGIKSWDHFSKIKGAENLIDLERIKKLIKLRFEFQKELMGKALDKEAKFAYYLCEISRYWRYRMVHLIYSLEHENKEDRNKLMILLTKLFTVYSVIYAKSVYEMHGFVANLIKQFLSGVEMDVLEKSIAEKLSTQNQKLFGQRMNESIAYSPRAKGLICRMLEYLSDDKVDIDYLFDDIFDVEHIQSYNDEDIKKREHILESWGEEINGIGNLMLLEFSINRAIQNKAFVSKKERYVDSKLSIPKDIAESKLPVWTKDAAKEKADKDIERLDAYLFDRG